MEVKMRTFMLTVICEVVHFGVDLLIIIVEDYYITPTNIALFDVAVIHKQLMLGIGIWEANCKNTNDITSQYFLCSQNLKRYRYGLKQF